MFMVMIVIMLSAMVMRVVVRMTVMMMVVMTDVKKMHHRVNGPDNARDDEARTAPHFVEIGQQIESAKSR